MASTLTAAPTPRAIPSTVVELPSINEDSQVDMCPFTEARIRQVTEATRMRKARNMLTAIPALHPVVRDLVDCGRSSMSIFSRSAPGVPGLELSGEPPLE